VTDAETGTGTVEAGAVPDRLANLRDVASAAPSLRPGALLRSDAPHAGDRTPQDVPWPPGTVLDLRDLAEKRFDHPLTSVARVIDLPVLDGAAASGETSGRTLAAGATRSAPVPASIPGLDELYLMMMEGAGAAHLVEAVQWVATGDAPVLVHCTAGKDRTGVTVALVLALVGVPREAIVADYERTDANMQGVMARASVTARLPQVDANLLAPLPPELATAPGWAIESVLDRLEAHDGGAEGWFLAHGGESGTLDALRSRLLAG